MRKLLVVAITLLASGVYAQNLVQDNLAYREEMNHEFADSITSPLTKEDLKLFDSLTYFPINEHFYVKAVFTEYTTKKLFRMPTTTEREPLYSTFGKIEFEIDGNPYALEVYQNQDLLKKEGYEDYLFLPFTDETNGEETYGGGRFLDFRIPKSDTTYIDFNKAYNPYCAYSHRYSCPIVPNENHLPIKIEAGVLTWKH